MTHSATPRRANNFDAIRLVAAFFVLFSHQFALTGRSEPGLFQGTTFGGLGVMIFFSISGYLISKSWMRSPDAFQFMKNRFLRIWPALAVATLISAFVIGPMVTSKDLASYLSSRETLAHVKQLFLSMRYNLPGVYITNPYPGNVNGSLWTIPIEVSWYGILLVCGLLGLYTRRYLLLLLASAFVGATWLVIYGVDERQLPLELGMFFVMGMVISTFERELLRHAKAVSIGVALIAVTAFLVHLDFVAAAFLIPWLTIFIGRAPSPAIGIGNAQRRRRPSDISYGVYLYAWPVQQLSIWYFDNRLSFLAGLAVSAAATTVLAILSWKFVESPFLKLKATNVHPRAPRPRTQGAEPVTETAPPV